jgi:hypothetical protein
MSDFLPTVVGILIGGVLLTIVLPIAMSVYHHPKLHALMKPLRVLHALLKAWMDYWVDKSIEWEKKR